MNERYEKIREEIRNFKLCVGKEKYPTMTVHEYTGFENILKEMEKEKEITDSAVNILEQNWLKTLLFNLGKEIERYETALDIEYVQNLNAEKYVSLNREDYYRVVEDYNRLVEKAHLRREELNALAKSWRDDEEVKAFDKGELKVAWSYRMKEEMREQKREATEKNYQERWAAIWHDIFAVICFVVGICLGFFTKSLITTLFVTFTSLLVMKEAFETSNITVAPRSANAYLFSYTAYSVVVGVGSSLWTLYLSLFSKVGGNSLIVFVITMLALLLILSSYNKKIFKKA
ncbi:MAG TPA: hypothetical protein P5230_01390 [Candidatus Magasanikbacteria bacterium]|nr:hypothetical protein [Candidatus Magasanikbacteria bacterium]